MTKKGDLNELKLTKDNEIKILTNIFIFYATISTHTAVQIMTKLG